LLDFGEEDIAMEEIATGWRKGWTTEFDAETIKQEIERFARLLSAYGIATVRVWCSHNTELDDDDPFQSPQRTLSPREIISFFDEAAANGSWEYGDTFNRAGIDAVDETFTFFLGNDKDIRLKSRDLRLLEEMRSAWVAAGFEVSVRDGDLWMPVE
jgi:hypothetical protein